MSKAGAPHDFASACQLVGAALRGPLRRELASDLSRARSLGGALTRLRDVLRANAFETPAGRVALEPIVNLYDRRTRDEGFHVLNDWDGKADHVSDDTIPIDVLNYVVRQRGDDDADASTLAVLIDYYFFHVLQLLALRVWDSGDPDDNLDRLAELLRAMQGSDGSGQSFVSDAETLILVATSHFEIQERGYDRLLARIRTLNRAHQTRIAIGHASSMGSHLRFGFEATYARDTVVMRDDNVADYPWLCYALATVVREYCRLRDEGGASAAAEVERDRIVEALVNGLSADARAFVGEPPPSLARCEAERAELRESFRAREDELLALFERFRPSERRYSPLSFFFNFSHNVVKGTIVDALLRGDPWTVSFNDLLTTLPDDPTQSAQKELLANTLMTYARLNPDRIRGQLMPVIVYDPQAGRQAFGTMMRRLRS